MDKYRVVIIDDEMIIREGLQKVVKWADFNCEVAGTAADARSGAALIREVRPDILITDICMPGQSGLVMLAGLRSEFPDMQVTVLTGYREFSYAQEAIRLGVTRFLLKPSKMAEINEALTVMVEKLKDREPSSGDQNTGSFIVNQAIAYMEKHYSEKLTPSIQSVKPSGIRRFFDIVNEMDHVISLSVGEPDFQTPWHVREAGIESLEQGKTWYTPNRGFKELCGEIVKFYKRKDCLHLSLIIILILFLFLFYSFYWNYHLNS